MTSPVRKIKIRIIMVSKNKESMETSITSLHLVAVKIKPVPNA